MLLVRIKNDCKTEVLMETNYEGARDGEKWKSGKMVRKSNAQGLVSRWMLGW